MGVYLVAQLTGNTESLISFYFPH